MSSVDCNNIQAKISSFLDGELGRKELSLYSEHLKTCEACSKNARLAESIFLACHALNDEPVALPVNFHASVMGALSEEKSRGRVARLFFGARDNGRGGAVGLRIPRQLRVAAVLVVCISVGLAASIFLRMYNNSIGGNNASMAPNVADAKDQTAATSTIAETVIGPAGEALGGDAYGVVTTVVETTSAESIIGEAANIAAPDSGGTPAKVSGENGFTGPNGLTGAEAGEMDGAAAVGYDGAMDGSSGVVDVNNNTAAEIGEEVMAHDTNMSDESQAQLMPSFAPPAAPSEDSDSDDNSNAEEADANELEPNEATVSKPRQEAILDSEAPTIAAPPLRNPQPVQGILDENSSMRDYTEAIDNAADSTIATYEFMFTDTRDNLAQNTIDIRKLARIYAGGYSLIDSESDRAIWKISIDGGDAATLTEIIGELETMFGPDENAAVAEAQEAPGGNAAASPQQGDASKTSLIITMFFS